MKILTFTKKGSCIERLWKWMKETVCYNTYYEDFHDFKVAIFGFFSTLSSLDPGSELWQTFKNKIRDRFRPMEAPISGALTVSLELN